MSIIVRDGDKIKIYCKGADIEISKRLSLKSKKSDKFQFLSKEALKLLSGTTPQNSRRPEEKFYAVLHLILKSCFLVVS